MRFCDAVNPAIVVDLSVITSAQDAGPSDTEPAHTLLKAAGAWAVDKAPLIAARFPGCCC